MPTNELSHQERTEQRESVSGGTLVYEPCDLGRELVALAEVDDYDALAHELVARGHGRGAIYHLPERDA